MLKPTLDVKPHEIPVLKELLMIRKAVTALYIVNNGYPVQGFPVEQGFAVSKKKKVLTSLTRPQSRIRLVPRKVSFSRFFFLPFGSNVIALPYGSSKGLKSNKPTVTRKQIPISFAFSFPSAFFFFKFHCIIVLYIAHEQATCCLHFCK